MLRPYFPAWLRDERTEFALEVISALLFGAALVCWLMASPPRNETPRINDWPGHSRTNPVVGSPWVDATVVCGPLTHDRLTSDRSGMSPVGRFLDSKPEKAG